VESGKNKSGQGTYRSHEYFPANLKLKNHPAPSIKAAKGIQIPVSMLMILVLEQK
jgi:hypothetical protein